jgi:hypothetical protein
MKIDLPLDRTARETLRQASKTLYGHMHVMECILVIGQAEGELFYQAGLAEAVACNANQAGRVIDKLTSLGVAERVPRDPGQSRDYHRRLPSVLWETTALQAMELLHRPAGSAVAKLADHR